MAKRRKAKNTPSRRTKSTPKAATLNTGENKTWVPASASSRERGYAIGVTNPTGWWADLTRERTPELRWPLSVQVYDDMVRQDAQVASVLNAVVTPILRTKWRVDGTGCDPKVTQHVASDLGLPIVGGDPEVRALRTRDRFSWTEHLAVAVPDHLQFGHAAFEQIYRKGDTDEDVLWHLRKLGYRPPYTIANWGIRPDGGLDFIQQWMPALAGSMVIGFNGQHGPVIPVNALVVYTNQRKGGNWIGISVLRQAYKNYMLKDRFLRIGSQVIERNGMGIPVHTAAGTTDPEIMAGEEIAENMRAGDNAGISLANGAKVELLGVTGKVADALPWVNYHDEQIARAVLAHFLNLGSQTGSWALGSTFADFFTLSIQAVAESVADTANQHIVEDLVDINYGPHEPAPRLVFDEIGSRKAEILSSINGFVDSGIVRPDEDLEKFVRAALDLPQANGLPYAPVPKTTIKEEE